MFAAKPKPTPITGQPFQDDDPLFTVIVADFEPSVSRDLFRRKMACLAAQTCRDFEVLVYHDGPKAQSYAADLAGSPTHPATQFFATPSHVGDWGHTGRDLGIRAARGRWIIHTNADNVFYPNFIAVLKDILTDPQPWVFASRPKLSFRKKMARSLRKRVSKWRRRPLDAALEALQMTTGDPQILIYGVVMRGMLAMTNGKARASDAASRQGAIYGGVPVQRGLIDAMQLVMRRDLWLAEGGWHDRSIASDGLMYPEFARKYRVLAVPVVLGEHW